MTRPSIRIGYQVHKDVIYDLGGEWKYSEQEYARTKEPKDIFLETPILKVLKEGLAKESNIK